MKKLILSLLLALASSLPLSAAQYNMWSQTNSYSGTPSTNMNLTFNQFNAVPAGWTVTSVVFTTTLNVSDASMFVTNITSDKTDTVSAYTLGVGGLSKLIIGGSTNSISANSGSVFLDPVISIPAGQSTNISGGPFTAEYTKIFTGGQTSPFVGEGTYNVHLRVDTVNAATVTGGGYTAEPLPGTAWGTVIANFFYSIPEPSTWAMIGAASLMFLVMKRRRA